MIGELFATPERMELAPGAHLLPAFAPSEAALLLEEIGRIAKAAPFRHMTTPGGRSMSVAMTNCGALGWVSDRRGYRYAPEDPESGRPWPPMPGPFLDLAGRAALRAGYPGFVPSACLVNRYAPGARLSLHQDRDEPDLGAPIVSVSLGLAAVFLLGGLRRSDPVRRIALEHGDVVVFGGPSRLCFHGIRPLTGGHHPLTGPCRLNLTFRKAD